MRERVLKPERIREVHAAVKVGVALLFGPGTAVAPDKVGVEEAAAKVGCVEDTVAVEVSDKDRLADAGGQWRIGGITAGPQRSSCTRRPKSLVVRAVTGVAQDEVRELHVEACDSWRGDRSHLHEASGLAGDRSGDEEAAFGGEHRRHAEVFHKRECSWLRDFQGGRIVQTEAQRVRGQPPATRFDAHREVRRVKAQAAADLPQEDLSMLRKDGGVDPNGCLHLGVAVSVCSEHDLCIAGRQQSGSGSVHADGRVITGTQDHFRLD